MRNQNGGFMTEPSTVLLADPVSPFESNWMGMKAGSSMGGAAFDVWCPCGSMKENPRAMT